MELFPKLIKTFLNKSFRFNFQIQLQTSNRKLAKFSIQCTEQGSIYWFSVAP